MTPSGIDHSFTTAELTAPVIQAGDGEPLVLLHGVAMSAAVWESVIPLLAPHHRVYAITMPGHRGGLPLPPGVTGGVETLAALVADQLDALGLDAAHLAGNSLGGWVSLELARMGRARSVVGLSPAGGWVRKRDLARLLAKFGFLRVSGPRAISWLQGSNPTLRRAALRLIAEHGDRLPVERVHPMFKDMAECTLLDRFVDRSERSAAAAQQGALAIKPFATAPCPVRIAWSEHDRLLPWRSYGRPVADAVPDSEIVIMRDLGHVPMIDDPQVVADTILAFTSRFQNR